MGRIICVANQKGGVGKTTTAVNLATSLAMQDKRVLLVDLDPQGNASSGLGLRENEGPTTYDLILGERQASDTKVATQVPALDLIPASRDLVGAEVELVAAPRREYRLADGLSGIRDQFDFVIIDCPPSLGLLTLNGLTAADAVVIPLQCEYYALEGLTALVDTIELIRENLNRNLAIDGIVLTMFDTRNSLSHQVSDEVRRHFPDRVFRTVIPRNVRLSESPSHGMPAALYDPASKGAQAYLDLAREMLAAPAEPLAGGASPGGEHDGSA